MSVHGDFDGFDEFAKELERYAKNVEEEKVLSVMEEAADMLVEDVRKLPKPRSAVATAGYTHLLDTIQHERKNKEIEVGWGKYYGPMVEHKTKFMRKEQPHLEPTFEKNSKRYYEYMTKKLFD